MRDPKGRILYHTEELNATNYLFFGFAKKLLPKIEPFYMPC